MSLLEIFISEALGTALLITLGVGVVATNLLTKSKGKDTGWLMINFGWGFAVMIGVYAAWKTGGHLNPAVTLGIAATGAEEFIPGIPVTFATIMTYIGGQMVGAMIGAALAWLAYKDHYDAHENQAEILGTFATEYTIRNYTSNIITEIIGTFVLLAWVIINGSTPTQIGYLQSLW